jgi:hypothetical protein
LAPKSWPAAIILFRIVRARVRGRAVVTLVREAAGEAEGEDSGEKVADHGTPREEGTPFTP